MGVPPAHARSGVPRSARSAWTARERIRAARRAANRRTLHHVAASDEQGEERLCTVRCECSRVRCLRKIRIDSDSYRQIRDRGRCVLGHGHERDDCEIVVSRTDRYLVVECAPSEIYLG